MSPPPHGGTRPGAGRKPGSGSFGESTQPVRVPESQVPAVVAFLDAYREQKALEDEGVRAEMWRRAEPGPEVHLSLMGYRVPAGFASPADDYVEDTIDLNAHLIRKGHVYIAQPPLYRIDVGKETHWARDDAHREEILAGLRANAKVDITRFKGLGEMNPDVLKKTTLDPRQRTLLRVTIDSNLEADKTFEELLGKDASARYRFIMEEAPQAVAEELADVLCYAMAIANELELDIASTMRAKMVKNEQKYPADQYRGRYGADDPGSPEVES